MDEPIVVALSETLQGPPAAQAAAVSSRVRLTWVRPDGTTGGDLADTEVVYRGGGLTIAGLQRLLPRLPRLRWVQVESAGVDGDLTPALRGRDVVITRTRGAHDTPVSEWVLLQLLAVTKRLPELVRQQAAHRWQPLDVPRTVAGRTLGIVGYGEIGQALALRARPLGLRIVGLRRHWRPAPELDAVYGPDGLGTLLAESDYVVLLAPLTAETRGLIGAAALRQMKPSAWLINVARGEIVDTPALLQALREGWIAGAALDVIAGEPLPPNSPWWDLPNVLLTPHNGGIKQPSAAGAFDQFVANLGRYVRGEPLLNQVDRAAGY
jgi:phosphoglycerate dehydrogenase-like enzyme